MNFEILLNNTRSLESQNFGTNYTRTNTFGLLKNLKLVLTSILLMVSLMVYSQSIITSKAYLTFDELNTTGTFTVTGSGLTESIALTAPTGYSVNPTTLASNATGATVTVTFNGLTEVKDFITLTSGTTTVKVRVIGSLNSTKFIPRYSSGNLITDPYFNSLTSYNGWGSRAITTDTTEVYSGSRSYKTSGACGGSLDFPLTGVAEANTTYILRAMVKTTGKYKFMINGFGVTADENYLLDVNTNGAWEQKEFVFTSGTLRANQNIFFNSCEGYSGTVAYLDNYELYRVILNASPYSLKFVGAGSQTLNVTGQGLSDPITLTAPSGFTVSPTSLPASSNISPVSVSFNGAAAKSGYIVLTSGAIKDSVFVEGTLTPTLSVAETFLSFDDMYTDGTINVTAGNLPDVITITAPDEFYVDPPQLPANTNNAVLSVTYNGPGEATGYITLTSGSLTAKVLVKGALNETKFKPRYTSTNLIADPYMNSLSTYAGWGSRSITADTTEVYSGSRSYKTTGGCGGSLDYSLTGKVESNTSYILRAMVNTTGRYKFIINGCDVNGSNDHFLEVTTKNGVWEQKEFVFTTGTLAANQNVFFNSCEGFNGSKAYIDNFELYKVDLVATPWELKFTGPSTKTISVTAQNLANSISIVAPAGFTVDPAILPAASAGASVSVTFDGNSVRTGYIVLTSGSFVDSVKVEGSLTPVLVATPTYLTFDELNPVDSIFVNSGNLSNVISFSTPSGYATDPAQLAASVTNAKVTVTFNGLAESKGHIILSSGATKDTVRVIGTLNSTKFTPLYAGNIISDPYFNSLADYGGWGSRNITKDTTEVYSGCKSYKTTGGCGGSLDFSLTGKVMPYTRYILRAMVKTTGTYKFIINGCDVNGSNDYFLDVNTGGAWQQVAYNFTTGALAANQNVFFNSCEGYDGNYALLDNYELYAAPAVWVSPNTLTFSGASSKTFTATAVNLSQSATITAPVGFTVSPSTIASNASGETVTVTFDGLANKEGYIYLISGSVKDSIQVSGTVTALEDLRNNNGYAFVENERIHVHFSLAKAANVEFAVYNAQGVLVSKQKAKYNAGKNSFVLNKALATGIYFIKMSQNGKTYSYKIVN